AVMLLPTMTSCGSRERPAEIILPKLEDAYNRHDLHAMSELYGSESNDAAEGVLGLFGLGDLASLMPAASALMGSSGMFGGMGTVELTEIKTKMDGKNKAVIDYNVKVSGVAAPGKPKVMNFDTTMIAVRRNEEWYVESEGGYTVAQIAPDDSISTEFTEDMRVDSGETVTLFGEGTKYGVVDGSDNMVIDFIYPDAKEEITDGLWFVKNMENLGGWGAVNAANIAVIPFEYEELGEFSNGLVRAKKGEYWGVINTKGEAVIDFQYEDMGEIKNGLVGVVINNAGGIIDMKGNYVVPLNKEYGLAQILPENFLFREFLSGELGTPGAGGSRFTLLDLSGKEIISGAFTKSVMGSIWGRGEVGTSIAVLEGETRFFIETTGESAYIIDTKGKVILDFHKHIQGLTYWEYLGNGWYRVDSDKGTNLMDENGKFLLDKWVVNAFDAKLVGQYILLNDYYSVLDTVEHEKRPVQLYSKDGQLKLTLSEDDTFSFTDNGYGEYDGEYGGEDFLIVEDPNPSIPYKKVIDLNNGISFDFGNTPESFNRGLVFVVQDENEIFYGLYINDKQIYPTEYHEIKTDEDSDGKTVVTLRKGTDTKGILIDRNGRVLEE
ncbi:MAG: WG repeat-containing protein, partial [Oscillospiraceae bacterium]|nr:WG repeat-containing protein [Oscillospiraceae bacterium]